MRALFPALLLLVSAAPPPPRVVSELSADTDTKWVSFDLTPGNQVRFTMQVDGRPVVAVLDTGVSFSALSQAYAASVQLKVRPKGEADAIGGVVPVGWAATRRLELGGLTRAGGGITVVALSAIATGGDKPVDMLVGRDLIGGFALDIDYDNKRFRLLPSGRMPFVGESAPLGISHDRFVYVSEISIGGRRIRPLIVDTGDGSSITISQPAWKSVAMSPVPPMTSAIAYGLGGTIETAVTILPRIDIGRLVARDVELRIEGKGGFSEAIGSAGRIGSAFLQRYRVLLDPSAGRMVFAPGRGALVPPPRSTSGLLLGFATGKLRVLHVMKNGPAEAGGWQTGEEICTVDGEAIPQGMAQGRVVNWSAGAPGRVVALGLCNGTQRTLTLRNFY